jgi:hypothetical protein
VAESPTATFSFPSPVLSAATAIRRLRCVGFTSACTAVEQLGVWSESTRILRLYRKYFPQPFARSTASTSIPIHQDERGYSERELEFFRLVDEHLFPLPEMMFDMERLSSIPIYPQGVDWEDERENMRLSLRAAMALVSDDDGMLWEAWLPPHLRPERGERDWDRLAEMCRNAKGLAKRFPLLLDLVALNTGNLWLDQNWECYCDDYPWEEMAVEYLKKEWRKAQRIFAQLNPLLDRMDKHPRYWLKRFVNLWNSAIKVPAKAR